MYNLLIVDDEPLTREYMKLNISSIHSSWTVAGEAGDGAEALDFLSEHNVDLVITDIKMPGIDGLELCKSISQMYPGLKVIILSGYDEFAYAKEAILYAVNEYLLKPIVKEDLKTALSKIAQKLEQEKNNEMAYKSLLNLSMDSREHVVKKFLQSLIHDSAVEIKTLYPLIYRMKINLLEGAGMIMMLELDEESLLLKDLPVSDIYIYKFIVNQAAAEMMEGNSAGRVFLDSSENTCILFTGDDQYFIKKNYTQFAEKINDFMQKNTGLTITAYTGCLVNDLLQLGISYKSADKLRIYSLVQQRKQLYECHDQNESNNAKSVVQVSEALIQLKSGFMNRNETNYTLSLQRLVSALKICDLSSVIRTGIFLIKALYTLNTDNSLNSGNAPEYAENALKLLKGSITDLKGGLTEESIIKLYKDIVICLSGRNTNPTNQDRHVNEEIIVNKAKEYICSHYHEPVSLASIAENAGISPGYLSQLFHKTAGESYIQFLTKIRMEQAAKLLTACPDEKLSQICEQVGYMGVKHFSYAFKQYYNMTPGEYRSKA